MLELLQVNSFYGASHVLRDIDLSVHGGEIVSILGRNGVGKTTLLKSILGLEVRTRGTITLDGDDITARPTYLRARAGIGYVPQGRELIPDFSIRDNILMGCYARGDGRRLVPDLVRDMFPYLRDNLGRRAGLLSGGQQQQLAIARALASEPRILLMDEPTEGIQPNIVEQIEDTIQRLNKQVGLTIVLVEQNVKFARAASQHFCIIERGEIAASWRDRRVDRRHRPQAHDGVARFRFTRKRSDSLSLTAVGRSRACARLPARPANACARRAAYAAGRGRGLSRVRAMSDALQPTTRLSLIHPSFYGLSRRHRARVVERPAGAVQRDHRLARHGARIETERVDAVAIRRRARRVERLYTADRAEEVLGHAGAEAVAGQRVGAREQGEALLRHHQMAVAALAANRAVAVLHLDRGRRLAGEAHPAAVAAATVGDERGHGSLPGLWKSRGGLLCRP